MGETNCERVCETESFDRLPVVWLLLEPHGAAIVEVCGELSGCTLAQSIDWGRHFLLGNAWKRGDVMWYFNES